MNMRYQCEHCDEWYNGEPHSTQTAPGYDSPVTLYFCEDCSNE